jgi:hypothetical protein
MCWFRYTVATRNLWCERIWACPIRTLVKSRGVGLKSPLLGWGDPPLGGGPKIVKSGRQGRPNAFRKGVPPPDLMALIRGQNGHFWPFLTFFGFSRTWSKPWKSWFWYLTREINFFTKSLIPYTGEKVVRQLFCEMKADIKKTRRE